MKNIIYILLATIFLSACYTDTVDSFKTFTFQFPVNIKSTYINRGVPSVSQDFSNLYKYDEYNDNKDKIKKAQILQFNYWLDSLNLENGMPYNPLTDDVQFDYVIYKLRFAKPKFGNPYSQDSTDFEIDESIEEFELGRYNNVNVRDFYRNPSHIIDVPLDVSDKISKYLIERPYFYIVTEYSRLNGQTVDKYHFPFLQSRFDVVIRFEVEVY